MKKRKLSEKATLFKLVLKMSRSAVFSLVHLEGLEPSIIDPKKLKPFVASSTFRIIFYHKIPYQKTLNPFIYRHFSHFILSNNNMQYKHAKIQHKTAHLQKSCIFLAKICSSNKYLYFNIQTYIILITYVLTNHQQKFQN